MSSVMQPQNKTRALVRLLRLSNMTESDRPLEACSLCDKVSIVLIWDVLGNVAAVKHASTHGKATAQQ